MADRLTDKRGKIVMAPPEVAARIADLLPMVAAEYVYTSTLIDPTKAYVIDLDALLAIPDFDFQPSDKGKA